MKIQSKNAASTAGAPGLRSSIETILARYARVRAHELFGKGSSLWSEFENIRSALAAAPTIARFSNVSLKWSAGQGRWATVPWIAALDARETSKTSEGVYVIYLFRADLSGVYLTLNQGTAWVMAGYGNDGVTKLRERAAILRGRVGSLEATGFHVGRGIDLRSDVSLVRGYEDSTVAFKLYSRGEVPSDEALIADLEAALVAYAKVVPSRKLLGLPGETLAARRLLAPQDDD